MLKNKDLLSKKKFIKAAALTSMPTIELTPEEADVFLDYVIDESFWKNNARIIKMAKPEKNLRFMGFTSGTRFLKPASTFASTDYVKEFGHDKITLTSKKCRGAVVIYDDDLDDNIEGQAFADHIMKLVAKKISNELDEAYYTSNTGFGSTDIRSLWEGWRYILLNSTSANYSILSGTATLLDAAENISGHSGDFVNTGNIAVKNTTSYIWEFKYAKMLSQLPSKYKVGGLKNLRFFQNDVFTSDYIEALADRGTVLGDNAILGGAPLTYGTIPIASVPLMPSDYTISGDTDRGLETSGSGSYGDCILTHKDNFIIGLQRELKMESKRAPEDEATYFFYNIRVDVAIENPAACVFLCNITHS